MIEVYHYRAVLDEGNETVETMSLIVLQRYYSPLVNISRIQFAIYLKHATGHFLATVRVILSIGLGHRESKVKRCTFRQGQYLLLKVIERHAQSGDKLKWIL